MPRVLAIVLLLGCAAASAAQTPSAEASWLGSQALRLTLGNGISSGMSLWRSTEDRLAELRIIVLSSREATDATAVMLRVGSKAHHLACHRIQGDVFEIPGHRSCFADFPGIRHVTTVSRCPLEWQVSQDILDGASVEVQVDTDWKLLKRKRLSAKQLARLVDLRPAARLKPRATLRREPLLDSRPFEIEVAMTVAA